MAERKYIFEVVDEGAKPVGYLNLTLADAKRRCAVHLNGDCTAGVEIQTSKKCDLKTDGTCHQGGPCITVREDDVIIPKA